MGVKGPYYVECQACQQPLTVLLDVDCRSQTPLLVACPRWVRSRYGARRDTSDIASASLGVHGTGATPLVSRSVDT
jgi:hypothetical protein